MSISCMGRNVHSLMLSIQHLPTTASPTLQGALKDDFGEAVVACDISEPCKFPSLDSQKRYVDPQGSRSYSAPSRLLQVGDAETLSHAFGFEDLDPFFFSFFLLFFRVSKQGPCLKAIQEDGGDKRLLELGFACKADGVALPDPA